MRVLLVPRMLALCARGGCAWGTRGRRPGGGPVPPRLVLPGLLVIGFVTSRGSTPPRSPGAIRRVFGLCRGGRLRLELLVVLTMIVMNLVRDVRALVLVLVALVVVALVVVL